MNRHENQIRMPKTIAWPRSVALISIATSSRGAG
jgi:hypothetical protein